MFLNLLLIVITILVLDSVVSASEAAIFTIPINKVKQLAQTSRRAQTLLALKENMEGPIVTLISLSNLITIIGSVIAGLVAARVFGEQWVGLFAAVLTFLIMIVAEIIPKRLGERFAEPVALVMAGPIKATALVFRPITWLIGLITGPFASKRKGSITKEELEFLAELGTREGVLDEYEGQLVRRVFKLADVTAGDMMTPRPFVFGFDGNKTLREAKDAIEQSKHSRVPVYEERLDKVIGMVHQRDLLRALAEDKYDALIRDFIYKPLVIPESRLGDDLLRDFLRSRVHLAVVVSDYGNMVGVIGLEDVLEELVGEIVDEKDVQPEFIKRISKNEIVAHGQTNVRDINRFFNTDIKSKKSLNGYLLRKVGRLPATGEVITTTSGNVTFTVEEVSASSIERVRIVKKE